MPEHPRRIDPVDCGCTDCVTGWSRPFSTCGDPWQFRALMNGEVKDATGDGEFGWMQVAVVRCPQQFTEWIAGEVRATRLLSHQVVQVRQLARWCGSGVPSAEVVRLLAVVAEWADRGAGDSVNCPAQFPPCPDCGGPLKLHFDTKYADCLNEGCLRDGIPAGDVVGEHGQPERGLPRPVIEGRRVPWLAPVIGDRVAWTALNAARLREAEQRWLCQVCGESLDLAPTAWVAVSAGEVATGGAMHKRCMEMARKMCPVLRADCSLVVTEVRREDQAHDWAAVIERLVAYEEQHGPLPDLVPLES